MAKGRVDFVGTSDRKGRRIIVAGATAWKDSEAIRRELAKQPPGTVVIHGDAPGADALAGEIASELGLSVEPMAKCEQDYAKYKQGAWKGLNERMIASDVTTVFVFHPNVQSGQGRSI